MITIEMTEEEAESLAVYLSMHSTDSAYDTFGVYEKLLDALDGGDVSLEGLSRIMERWNHSQSVRKVTTVDEAGLIVIGERVE